MVGEMSDSEESLFFYAQRNSPRRFKRVRKEPEELPQALRYFKYANLNPRIAAFLGKQDPKNLIKRALGAKGGGGNHEENEGNGDAPDGNINDALGLLGGFGIGLSQEARSLLPEIGQGGLALVKMGALDDIGGQSRLSFNETDDPQRYQFEETTFAAPNILRELSETLARFNNAFNEYVKRTKIHEEGSHETPKPADVLPIGIQPILSQEWAELTSEAIYTPRVWQSLAYKSGYKYASTLASAGRQMTATTGVEKDAGTKGDLKRMVDLLDVKPSKSMAADTSTVPGTAPKKKGRGFDKDVLKAHMGKIEDRLPRHGGNPTLSFNLSSKKAFDEGWVVNAPPDPDLQQANLLEWAMGRLQIVMKQKEDEEEHARNNGCDKPTVMRYYGDSRRDTLMKLYRKSNEGETTHSRKMSTAPKIPQLSKIDSAQRERFMVQLPDGSTTIFYPGTGEVAVMASAVPSKPGELYVNCYDNDDDRTCVAVFTPYGKSCCYHKNGVPALVLSEAGGVLKSEDGSVARKWTWPKHGKMKDSIVYHINKEMHLRILNRDNVTLYFSSSRETHKIPVGTAPGAQSPINLSPECLGVLQTGLRMTSKSALDYSGALRLKDEKPKFNRMRRNIMLGYRKQPKKAAEIDDLKKSLDVPDRFEFESQADRELQRLQYKSKFLIEDWMEHYRFAVGISSPALKTMTEKAVVKSPKRNIRSAVEQKQTSGDFQEALEELIRGSTRCQSFRSPSAPSKHTVLSMAKKRASVSSEPDSKQPETGKKVAHVRIDERVKELKTPASGKRFAARQFKSAFTGESRTLLGRSAGQPGQRHLRSSVLTSMSVQHPQTPGQDNRPNQEKSWGPPLEACPVITRLKIFYPDSTKVFVCKCSKHRVPFISDIEFDIFVREVVPQTQLIVVSVINSLHEDSNPYSEMLENIYLSKNRNRTMPCLQSRHDQYRILRYDLARAHVDTDMVRPLQFERHCVVPGMTLMYCGGRLLFADHIFNGYGNARNDFRKQVFKSKQDFHVGHYLPNDFRFSPNRGKSGPRAAWGGEIGGTGVHGKGKPGLLPGRKSVPASTGTALNESTQLTVERLSKSATYSASSQSNLSTSVSHLQLTKRSRFDSARDFVQFSLSTKGYVKPAAQKNPYRRPTTILPRESSHSPEDTSQFSDPVVSQTNNFLMMQAVK